MAQPFLPCAKSSSPGSQGNYYFNRLEAIYEFQKGWDEVGRDEKVRNGMGQDGMRWDGMP